VSAAAAPAAAENAATDKGASDGTGCYLISLIFFIFELFFKNAIRVFVLALLTFGSS